MKKIYLLKTFLLLCALMAGSGSVWGQEYQELYNSGSFSSVATHGYTQDKTFTLSEKSWTASVSQVNSGVFYLGCNSNNAFKGVLSNNSTFSDVVTALRDADETYDEKVSEAHAYALLFDNSYSNVTKVTFDWDGGNNAFQVYLFGDSGSGYVLLGSTNYATSGATTPGSVEWTGDATDYTKFAIVARPGTTSSTAASKTLRPNTFKIYTTSGGGSSATATTTEINVPNNFNTDIYTSTTAGTLTATVTPDGGSALESPAITWTSSNTDVATIDENSGAVTLVAVGTTTITASYAGETDVYGASSDTYELVVTSSAPATLPFKYDGNGTGTLPQGFTVQGLGSSYDESPKMKFDDTGDCAILKIGEEPGKLSFDIKGNDFSNGTFKVQQSADGETYTDLATYTVFEGTTESKVLYPDADTRYIKWIYTEKVTGNVALGNIKFLGVQANGYTLNVTGEDADAMAELSVDDSPLDENDEIVYGSEVTVTVATTDGYSYAISVKDANNNDVTVTNDTFIMPNSAVTVTVTTSINLNATATLTGSDMSGMTNAGDGYGTYKSIVKDGLTWGTNGYQTGTLNTMIQLRTRTNSNGVSYIQLPTFSGYIQTITMSVTSANANSEGKDKTNTVLNFQTGATKDETVVATGGGSSTNEIVIDLSELEEKYSTGYITAAGGARIWNISVAYEPEVKVTISDANYATFYNRWFAVNFSSTGIKAYTAEDDVTSVKLNEITSGKVPAQTPVVLYKAGGCTDLNVPVIASAEDPEGTNDLRVSTGTDVANMYVLANKGDGVGFYPWVKNNEDLAAGKVYLLSTYGARQFLPFDSDSQGISATQMNNEEIINNNVYDLQGRRVVKPAKGLYIMDGRKVLVK